MRIVVSGATGLVGRALVRALVERGDTVTALSRDPAQATATLGVPAHAWDPLAGAPPAAALAVDGVVHLAGESVAARRWSATQKKKIFDSRVVGTRHLVAGIARLAEKPSVLVAASAVGYYGDRAEPVDETAAPGAGFLADVVRAWEAETVRVAEAGVREVRLRFGVVLSTEGGALARMLGPFRAGLGGRLGNGRQGVPWIHVVDAVGLVVHALETPSLAGAVNAVAPETVDNAAFTRALGDALGRPAVVPVPGLALRALFGERASVLLEGQRVLPRAAQASGYAFRFPTLAGALANLVDTR